ncbi:glycosyltransferase family 2 protein [Aestuariibius insulae]|uniref:glycosyltransferase family 2 protein n=1 Tax=Aestuariibius insulae TaxID=2058287 RepID=UPI00345E18E4
MIDATLVIAAYNAEATLSRSIQSALAQTGIRPEIIIVDDASQDQTACKARTFPGVQVDRLIRNGGPAAARNRALELATAEWIAILDADDTTRPDRLSNMIRLAKQTGADVVLGNFVPVTPDGSAVEGSAFLSETDVTDGTLLSLEDYVARNMVRHDAPSLGYLKPLFRKSFLDREGLQYDETLRNGEDCHLIFEALAKGAKVVVSMSPDYLYCVRPGSVSHRANPDHIQSLINADTRFLNKYQDSLSARTKMLFAQRRTALTDMMRSEQAISALKNRDLRRILSIFAARPRTAIKVSRQMTEAVAKRLKRRNVF